MIGKNARESKEVDGNCPDFLPEKGTKKQITSSRTCEPLSCLYINKKSIRQPVARYTKYEEQNRITSNYY